MTGIIPMPLTTEIMLGGHCVDIVGYNLNDKTMRIRNSWGKTWGQCGYGVLPIEYIEKLSDDNWVITIL
jgi:C1A family cysteine protease